MHATLAASEPEKNHADTGRLTEFQGVLKQAVIRQAAISRRGKPSRCMLDYPSNLIKPGTHARLRSKKYGAVRNIPLILRSLSSLKKQRNHFSRSETISQKIQYKTELNDIIGRGLA